MRSFYYFIACICIALPAIVSAYPGRPANSNNLPDQDLTDIGYDFHYGWRLLNLNLQYEKFMDVWVANDKSINSIRKTFETNRKVHDKFFAELNVFAKKYEVDTKAPDELTDLQKQLEDLAEDFASFEAKYRYIDHQDYAFDISLFSISKGLDVLGYRFGIVSEYYENQSDSETVAKIAAAMKSIKEARSSIHLIRNQSREISRKRQRAYYKAYLVVKGNLKTRFANKAKIELSELEKKIDAALKADKLAGKLWAWSSKHGVNGLGGRAHNTFYQWRQTFRNIETAIQEGLPIGQEIEEIDVPEETKRTLRRKYRIEMKFYNEGIVELKQLGWESFSAHHIRRAKRWKGDPDRFSAKCVDHSKVFLQKYEKDKDFEDYLIQEREFKNLTLVCLEEAYETL